MPTTHSHFNAYYIILFKYLIYIILKIIILSLPINKEQCVFIYIQSEKINPSAAYFIFPKLL